MLQDAGIDAIEVSGGTLSFGQVQSIESRYQVRGEGSVLPDRIKGVQRGAGCADHPGGWGSLPGPCREASRAGSADYFSMSRPFIREPDLVKRWASGDRSKARCLSDNQCFGPGRAGEGVYCVTEKKEKEKRA